MNHNSHNKNHFSQSFIACALFFAMHASHAQSFSISNSQQNSNMFFPVTTSSTINTYNSYLDNGQINFDNELLNIDSKLYLTNEVYFGTNYQNNYNKQGLSFKDEYSIISGIDLINTKTNTLSLVSEYSLGNKKYDCIESICQRNESTYNEFSLGINSELKFSNDLSITSNLFYSPEHTTDELRLNQHNTTHEAQNLRLNLGLEYSMYKDNLNMGFGYQFNKYDTEAATQQEPEQDTDQGLYFDLNLDF